MTSNRIIRLNQFARGLHPAPAGYRVHQDTIREVLDAAYAAFRASPAAPSWGCSRTSANAPRPRPAWNFGRTMVHGSGSTTASCSCTNGIGRTVTGATFSPGTGRPRGAAGALEGPGRRDDRNPAGHRVVPGGRADRPAVPAGAVNERPRVRRRRRRGEDRGDRTSGAHRFRRGPRSTRQPEWG
jgi:hypothetical protein